MRAVKNPNDAAFGALSPRYAAGAALDFCEDVVAMHGVFDGVAGNEDVTIELRHRSFGHDKPIAIVMKNQASFYFIVMREGGVLDLL